MIGIAVLWFLLLAHTAWVGLRLVIDYYEVANRPDSFAGHTLSTGGASDKIWRYVVVFVREWWFGLVVAFLYPWGWRSSSADRTYRPELGPPIVLVHGYLMNRSCMFALRWRLRRRGYGNVHTLNLRPSLAPIETLGASLQKMIRERSQAANGEPVFVVAHSMGGLVARWCLQNDPDLPVRQLVTLATPHQGSRLAVLGIGSNAVQMRIHSEFLRALDPEPRVPWLAVFARIDGTVIPSENAALGPFSRGIEGVGHTSILFCHDVVQMLVERIPAPNSGTSQTAVATVEELAATG